MRPPSQLTLLSDSQAKAIERDQIECHISAAVTRHTCSLRAACVPIGLKNPVLPILFAEMLDLSYGIVCGQKM